MTASTTRCCARIEIAALLGGAPEDVLPISAKEGTNIDQLLERIVKTVPPPSGVDEGQLRALIFGSHYDPYKGVIAYVRIVSGRVRMNDRFKLMATDVTADGNFP